VPVLAGNLAPDAHTGHTSTMSLKNASALALVGMIVLSVLVAADFIHTCAGIARDVSPMMALLRSLIYLIASITVTIFLFVFHRAQRWDAPGDYQRSESADRSFPISSFVGVQFVSHVLQWNTSASAANLFSDSARARVIVWL
jgi:hypothetical protein